MKLIKILVADDHLIVREGIRAILRTEGDIEIIGEADNGRTVVEMAALLHPDVVLMDVAMPFLNGLEAAAQIRRCTPSSRIIMLSAHADDAHVAQALKIGVEGYLIKQTSAGGLARAIRAVANGRTFFQTSLSETLPGSAPGSTAATERPLPRAPLTSRENEILQLIAEGLANKQSAAELGISIKTVEKHRQNLMDKLDVHDTAGLTRHAIAAGIIESSVQSTTSESADRTHSLRPTL